MSMNKNALALIALASFAAATAAEESFPSKPITIVVPYTAGGTSDAQVRMIQEPLSKLLGQPIVIENKPGASGAIAAQYVARAKADGHILLYPNNGVLFAPLLNEKAGYDPLKDFKPITLTTLVPMVLVVNKSVPVSTAADFVAYARQQKQGVLYASAGTASFGHLASSRLAQMTGIKLEHVPYRGEANTTMAVRAGEVQMLLTTPSSAMLGQVEQGHMKLLGVASPEPSPVVPGATPLNRSIPGFSAEVWFGLMAPAGTPNSVIEKLMTSVHQVMAEPAIAAKLKPSGALVKTSSPQELAALMKAETEQWRELIAKFNIKAD